MVMRFPYASRPLARREFGCAAAAMRHRVEVCCEAMERVIGDTPEQYEEEMQPSPFHTPLKLTIIVDTEIRKMQLFVGV